MPLRLLCCFCEPLATSNADLTGDIDLEGLRTPVGLLFAISVTIGADGKLGT